VTAAYLTGWRLTSELATRQWRHLDLKAGWMRLEPGETKGGEGRQFPLIPELRASLQAQQRATRAAEKRSGSVVPWVFHHDGAPLFYRSERGLLPSTYLRDAWLAACAKAGLDSIRHDFRRTAARNLIRAGVPAPTVMAAVGWSSFAMLKRYAIVDEGSLREAGAKLAKLR
jgi:integrase